MCKSYACQRQTNLKYSFLVMLLARPGDVHGDPHDTLTQARAGLARIQSMLFPEGLPAAEWFDARRRKDHLERVKETARHVDTHRRSAAGKRAPELASRLAFPHDARTLQNDYPGFRNLGATCYLNAVLQCIFHCDPLASALRRPRALGIIDTALQNLLQEYVASGNRTFDVICPTNVINEMCRHAGFALGRQQDAAECLRQLLCYSPVLGSLCDSGAAAVDGSVLLCYTPDAARVARAASAVDMQALLLEATTGETALERSPDALMLRIENTYEEGGELFWVDALAKWPDGPYPITTKEAVQAQRDYDVQAYLVHRHDAGADVSSGVRSGHYVAYFKCDDAWYRADDEQVSRLSDPPTEFPYVVFLTRSDRKGGWHLAALTKRGKDLEKARRTASSASGGESGRTVAASSQRSDGLTGGLPSARDRSGRDRSGQDESDRSGRHQRGRDASGQDRSGQDRSGRDQSGRLDERVERAWGNRGDSDNRDHSRTDDYSNLDHPYSAFVKVTICDARQLRSMLACGTRVLLRGVHCNAYFAPAVLTSLPDRSG